MPSYKLTYFDLAGRAEVPRLLFALAGQKYEMNTIKQEDWPKLKEKTPFGGLPTLEVDGKVCLGQSNAISRYLAKEFGFYGKDALEQAVGDMIVDELIDVFDFAIGALFGKEGKEEKLKKLNEEKIPGSFARVEKLVKGSTILASGLTWVDLVFFNIASIFANDPCKDIITVDYSKLPKLKAIKENVAKNPKIAEYIKSRDSKK